MSKKVPFNRVVENISENCANIRYKKNSALFRWKCNLCSRSTQKLQKSGFNQPLLLDSDKTGSSYHLTLKLCINFVFSHGTITLKVIFRKYYLRNQKFYSKFDHWSKHIDWKNDHVWSVFGKISLTLTKLENYNYRFDL